MNRVVFRPAEENDARFVWDVNNDPSVRRQSISTEPIPWDTHTEWFSRSLDRSDRHLWIALVGDSSAGVVRFDLDNRSATISIALSAEYRGQGLGTETIRLACEKLRDDLGAYTVIAHVRPDNASSIRAFERAGFALRGTAKNPDVVLNEYLWEH